MKSTVSILGAGAIGQLLAHKLTDASVECQFIISEPEKYDSENWQCRSLNHQLKTRPLAYSLISESEPLDLVFVCVKASDLLPALKSVQHRISDTTKLVLFQNGMGHEAIAHQFVAQDRLYFASNTHGAYRESSQQVVHAGSGHVIIGAENCSDAPGWFSDLQQSVAKLEFDWSNDIKTVLWRKLFVNAIINPLTAIYQCKNGELLDERYKPQLLALIEESRRIAEHLQLSFSTDLKSIVLNVIEQTASNYSSMYQDVQAGRLTEIDAINGYLLDQVSAHQLGAPHHWSLWSQFHINYPPLKKLAEQKAKNFDDLTYHVTQEHGTERPFTGQYNLHHEKGVYRCICCGSELFDDLGKFDSGCGWPSFDRAKDNKAIAYKLDTSHNMQRTEILCAQCGSHLGHVFEDGPTTTGQRFCVNSVSLRFNPITP